LIPGPIEGKLRAWWLIVARFFLLYNCFRNNIAIIRRTHHEQYHRVSKGFDA